MAQLREAQKDAEEKFKSMTQEGQEAALRVAREAEEAKQEAEKMAAKVAAVKAEAERMAADAEAAQHSIFLASVKMVTQSMKKKVDAPAEYMNAAAQARQLVKPPLERLIEMGYDKEQAQKTLNFVSGDVNVAKAVMDRMAQAKKSRNKALENLRKRKAPIKVGNIY